MDPPQQAKPTIEDGFIHCVKRNKFTGDRDQGLMLLVYPNDWRGLFNEKASHGLKDADMKMMEQKSKAKAGVQASIPSKANGNFRCSIRVLDYCRLVHPEEYLNEQIIDFWMLW